jgi:heat shock protein 5
MQLKFPTCAKDFLCVDFNARNVHHPGSTVGFRKEFLGRKWSDPAVKNLAKCLPYKVVGEEQDIVMKFTVEGQEKSFTAEQMCGMILSKLRSIAEARLGEKVTHAVVTVPVSFTDAQRQAVRSAGDRAGLSVLRVLNEATAAAIAYGLDRGNDGANIIVFDLGGTILKVTLLNIDGGVFETLASDSADIGGANFNKPVVD